MYRPDSIPRELRVPLGIGLRRTLQPPLPPFRPPVLEPRLDLRVRHLQGLGEGGALRRRQVLLPVEALLELADLQARERRPRLLLFGGRAVLVRVTYAACYSEW